jgi:hypothetical protein
MLYQQSLRTILNKTLSISTSLGSNQLAEFHNQDFKARETPEFNHQSKLALKFPLTDNKTTKANPEMQTNLNQG